MLIAFVVNHCNLQDFTCRSMMNIFFCFDCRKCGHYLISAAQIFLETARSECFTTIYHLRVLKQASFLGQCLMVAWIVCLLSCFPKMTGTEICHNLTARCLDFQQVQGKVWATDCGRDRQTCIRQAEANWICSCRGESFLLWSSPSVAEHCGIGKFWSHEMSQLWITREKFELVLPAMADSTMTSNIIQLCYMFCRL